MTIHHDRHFNEHLRHCVASKEEKANCEQYLLFDKDTVLSSVAQSSVNHDASQAKPA